MDPNNPNTNQELLMFNPEMWPNGDWLRSMRERLVDWLWWRLAPRA